MISADEKRCFVDKLIDSLKNSDNSPRIEEQLYELLLKDTAKGKIYKYRSFDKEGFSLKNLTDNTLHCSSPMAFNDPFDCKCGITYTSVFEAKYNSNFSVMNDVFDKIMPVVKGEIDLSSCTDVEQRIISKIINNEQTMKFFSEIQGRTFNDEEKSQFLYENKQIIIDILQAVFVDEAITGEFKTEALEGLGLLNRISSNGMKVMLKDNATLEDFARANEIFSDTDADELDIIYLLCEIFFPQKSLSIEESKKNLHQLEIISDIQKSFLVGCLCTDYKNKLMWSHYAESHKGFCIEYDYSNWKADSKIILPLPVIYSRQRPPVFAGVHLENPEEAKFQISSQLMKGLLTKDNDWSYENEWRIILHSTNVPNISMPPISCIYLGVSISDGDKTAILNIAKEKNYKVKQMVVDKGTYDLHAKDIV